MIGFLSVNYGTSRLVDSWISSIVEMAKSHKFKIVIVDNFKNELERKEMRRLSLKYDFVLLESENIGYGAALNLAIRYCQHEILDMSHVFCGNLDITYLSMPSILPQDVSVLVPVVLEGARNRNPFLTKLQYKSVLMHRKNVVHFNSFLFGLITSVTRFLGLFPSPIWAVHGSLFCFHVDAIKADEKVFNDESFLYCEEMEFASYMHSRKVKFVTSPIVCRHEAHAATSEAVFESNNFGRYWRVSFKNWMGRWL